MPVAQRSAECRTSGPTAVTAQPRMKTSVTQPEVAMLIVALEVGHKLTIWYAGNCRKRCNLATTPHSACSYLTHDATVAPPTTFVPVPPERLHRTICPIACLTRPRSQEARNLRVQQKGPGSHVGTLFFTGRGSDATVRN